MILSGRQERLLACDFVENVLHLAPDKDRARYSRVLAVVRRHARGEVDDDARWRARQTIDVREDGPMGAAVDAAASSNPDHLAATLAADHAIAVVVMAQREWQSRRRAQYERGEFEP